MILWMSLVDVAVGDLVRGGRERGCVVGDNTGLEFREVASKGPLDALIRGMCRCRCLGNRSMRIQD